MHLALLFQMPGESAAIMFTNWVLTIFLILAVAALAWECMQILAHKRETFGSLITVVVILIILAGAKLFVSALANSTGGTSLGF